MSGLLIELWIAGEAAPVPGVGRIFPYSKIAAGPVTVTCKLSSVVGITSFYWEVVSQPYGATAVLSDPTAAEPTFEATMAKPGTYIVRCEVNGGQAFGTCGLAYRTEIMSLRAPAPSEDAQFGTDWGWAAAIREIVEAIDAGHPFEFPEVVQMTATGPVSTADSGKIIQAVLTAGTPTLDMELPPAAAGLYYYLTAYNDTAPPASYAVAELGANFLVGRYTQEGRWGAWQRVRLAGSGDLILVIAVEVAPATFQWYCWEGHGDMSNDATPTENWAWEIPCRDYVRWDSLPDLRLIPWFISDMAGNVVADNANGTVFINTTSAGDVLLTLTATQADQTVCRVDRTHAANNISIAIPVGVDFVLPDGEILAGTGAGQLTTAAHGASATLVYQSVAQVWSVSLEGEWVYTGTADQIPTAALGLQQAYEFGPGIELTAVDGDLALTLVGAVSMTWDLSAVTGTVDGLIVTGPGGQYEETLVDDTVPGLRVTRYVQSHAIASVEGYARGYGVPNPANLDEWALSSGNPTVARPSQTATDHMAYKHTADAVETIFSFDMGTHNKGVVGRALVICATNAVPTHVMGWEITFGAYGVNGGAAVVSPDFTVVQITNSDGDLDRDITIDGAAGGVAGVVRFRGTGKINDTWSVRLDFVETTVPIV